MRHSIKIIVFILAFTFNATSLFSQFYTTEVIHFDSSVTRDVLLAKCLDWVDNNQKRLNLELNDTSHHDGIIKGTGRLETLRYFGQSIPRTFRFVLKVNDHRVKYEVDLDIIEIIDPVSLPIDCNISKKTRSIVVLGPVDKPGITFIYGATLHYDPTSLDFNTNDEAVMRWKNCIDSNYESLKTGLLDQVTIQSRQNILKNKRKTERITNSIKSSISE